MIKKKYLNQGTHIYIWINKLWNAICCVSFPRSMIKCHSKILDLHLALCKKRKTFYLFCYENTMTSDRKSQIWFYDEKLWIIFLIENRDLVLWCKKEWVL